MRVLRSYRFAAVREAAINTVAGAVMIGAVVYMIFGVVESELLPPQEYRNVSGSSPQAVVFLPRSADSHGYLF